MASAAAAVNVPDHKIRHLGGWAPGSTTLNDYVNLTVVASREALDFFAFLLGPQAGNLRW
jgi:hypothetical protein